MICRQEEVQFVTVQSSLNKQTKKKPPFKMSDMKTSLLSGFQSWATG